MDGDYKDMDVDSKLLTERQGVFLPAVICLIRAHTRRFPIKSEQLCDLLNFWLAEMYPGEKPYGTVEGTDIRDIARHCRTLPWPETIPICSDKNGYYWGYEAEDFDPYLHHMTGRIRAISKATRPMANYQDHLRTIEGAGLRTEPQGDMFGALTPAWINQTGPPPRANLLALLHGNGEVNSLGNAGRAAKALPPQPGKCLPPERPSPDAATGGGPIQTEYRYGFE